MTAPISSSSSAAPHGVSVPAAWLMDAVSDSMGTSTASRLMEEAASLRTVYETDPAVGEARDSEDGYAPRDPAVGPRIPFVTAGLPHQPVGRPLDALPGSPRNPTARTPQPGTPAAPTAPPNGETE